MRTLNSWRSPNETYIDICGVEGGGDIVTYDKSQVLGICPKCGNKKYIFKRYFDRSRCVCGSKFNKFKARFFKYTKREFLKN